MIIRDRWRIATPIPGIEYSQIEHQYEIEYESDKPIEEAKKNARKVCEMTHEDVSRDIRTYIEEKTLQVNELNAKLEKAREEFIKLNRKLNENKN